VFELLKIAEKSSSRSNDIQNRQKSSSKLSSSKADLSSSTLKDSSNARNSDDADPSRVKTLCDSPDHISAKLNQRMLSADHGVPSSNIASSVASDDSNSSSNAAETVSLKTTGHRPKTVKTLGSKMRSTGKARTRCQPLLRSLTFYSDCPLNISGVLC